jgi:hypothetical protein
MSWILLIPLIGGPVSESRSRRRGGRRLAWRPRPSPNSFVVSTVRLSESRWRGGRRLGAPASALVQSSRRYAAARVSDRAGVAGDGWRAGRGPAHSHRRRPSQ